MKLSSAYVVINGRTWEVHQREYDEEGRYWERTTAGPFQTAHEARTAADAINFTYYL